jgi:FkbM family methyltransferase
MPSPRRLARQLANRRVPLRTRLGLVGVGARRRLRPANSYAVRYGPGVLHLSHDDLGVDRASLDFVLAEEAYATDYGGAVVLDIGAHKGYFGAYALVHGARTVVSFEPERANLVLLDRAAATFRAAGGDWDVRGVAVGPLAGEAELHVMRASWGHALHPPDSFAEHEVGMQRVPVRALVDVLADAERLAHGARIVAKINIEGEECATVLGTPPEAWEDVSEVFVETHSWAPCGADELAAHLGRAELTRAASEHPAVLRLRRAGAPRPGRSTDPG